jgi:hypothetical protein
MNIDDYLGDKKRIEDAINDAYAEAPREETRRYIGASGVGNPCNQYLALCLRGYPESEIIPKLKRIFRDGHRIEEDVVADLKLAGYDVKEVEIIDYDEFEYADLQRRIKIVLDGNERRLSTTATDWRCKTCFKRSACWEGETYPAACHNCSHAKPSQMGNKSWWCGKHDIEAVKICDDHNYYQPRPSVAS